MNSESFASELGMKLKEIGLSDLLWPPVAEQIFKQLTGLQSIIHTLYIALQNRTVHQHIPVIYSALCHAMKCERDYEVSHWANMIQIETNNQNACLICSLSWHTFYGNYNDLIQQCPTE